MIRVNHSHSNIFMLDLVDTRRNVIFSTFPHVLYKISKAIKKGRRVTK